MALTKVVFDMASGVEAADAAILKSDQTGTLTVGYDVTTFNAGTQSSGNVYSSTRQWKHTESS